MDSIENVETIRLHNKNETERLIDLCKSNVTTKKFLLCRNEDVAVFLINKLNLNGFIFDIYALENKFFKSVAYKDIVAFLTLTLYPHNMDVFKSICYKSKLFLSKEIIREIIDYCNSNSKSIYDILDNEKLKLNRWQMENIRRFISIMKSVGESEAVFDALQKIFNQIYSEHLHEKGYRYSIIDVLKSLAKKEEDIEKYLSSLVGLQTLFDECMVDKIDEYSSNIIITSIDNYEEVKEYSDVAYVIELLKSYVRFQVSEYT